MKDHAHISSPARTALLTTIALAQGCFITFDEYSLETGAAGSASATTGGSANGGSSGSSASGAAGTPASGGVANGAGTSESGGVSGAAAGSGDAGAFTTGGSSGETGESGSAGSLGEAGAIGCKTGTSNCNGQTSDGCECFTPGCCETACQFTHKNGLGTYFYDCVAVSTYNQEQALGACKSFTGDPAMCTQKTCSDGNAICSSLFNDCACWGYDGAIAGLVYDPTDTAECSCPTSSTTSKWK